MSYLYDPLGDGCRDNHNTDYHRNKMEKLRQETARKKAADCGNNQRPKGTTTQATIIQQDRVVKTEIIKTRLYRLKVAHLPEHLAERYLELDDKYTNNFLTPAEMQELRTLQMGGI